MAAGLLIRNGTIIDPSQRLSAQELSPRRDLLIRDGRIAAMNDMAHRVLAVPHREEYIGRPFSEVLHDVPEVVRVLQQAFDSSDLPNRAEMRLRKTGRAMGYTLSHIHDDDGRMVGATMFFKDLTRVEQIEERERLRDRLAALDKAGVCPGARLCGRGFVCDEICRRREAIEIFWSEWRFPIGESELAVRLGPAVSIERRSAACQGIGRGHATSSLAKV